MKAEAIEQRIRDEQRKHPDLDWIKIASQKIAKAIKENNMENLIGRKVRGFKFEYGKYDKLDYISDMDNCLGKIGEIKRYHETDSSFWIDFGDVSWDYPAELIHDHLVEEGTEYSTEEILKIIYDKWGEESLENAITEVIHEDEYDKLKQIENYFEPEYENKTQYLIQKWHPKKYLRIINNEIQVSHKELSQSIEITPEVKEQLKKIVEC